MIPIEGLNYLWSVALKGGTQYPNLYVGLFKGDYTPQPSDTMATFTGLATEQTLYSETARVPLLLGAVASGAVNNADDVALFTGTTSAEMATGGFISTSPTKGSTTGVLIAAVRFPSPLPLGVGNKVEITAPFTAISV